ncbi:MAG: HAD family hydrolase [Chloroflexota bacterium]|nr:HAD family hydrolase [Chloroflexota bacterium]
MALQALLFDLDNTLVPEMPNCETAFMDTVADTALHHGFSAESLRRAVFGVAEELWLGSGVSDYCARVGIGSPTSLLSDFPGDAGELRHLREWAPQYRRESWSRGLSTVGLRDAGALVAELDAAFRGRLRVRCPPYPDVIRVLEELSPQYRLAVATNGPVDVQWLKLTATGLERYFPVVVASSEVGFGKPDARIFTATLDRLGVAATDALAIGDSLERDVAGSKAASLACVWVNRTGAVNDDRLVPEFEIHSLEELPALLR